MHNELSNRRKQIQLRKYIMLKCIMNSVTVVNKFRFYLAKQALTRGVSLAAYLGECMEHS